MDSLARNTIRKIEALRCHIDSFGHIIGNNVERLIKSGPILLAEYIKSNIVDMHRDLESIQHSIHLLSNAGSEAKPSAVALEDFFSHVSDKSRQFADYFFNSQTTAVASTTFEYDPHQSPSDVFAEIQLQFQPSRQSLARDFDVSFHCRQGTGTGNEHMVDEPVAPQYVFKMTYPNLFHVSLDFTIQDATIVTGPLRALSSLETETENEQRLLTLVPIESQFTIFTTLSNMFQKYWSYEFQCCQLDGRSMSLSSLILLLEKLHDFMSSYDALFDRCCFLCSRIFYEDAALNKSFSHLQLSTERLPPLLRLFPQTNGGMAGDMANDLSKPMPIHPACYLKACQESSRTESTVK